MAAIDREFEFVVASVERTVRLQAEPARRHLTSEAVRGRAVATHLAAMYDAIEAHVKTRRTQFASLPDAASKEGAITEMRALVVRTQQLQDTLAWIDAAENPPLDLGSTYFVDHAARALVTPDAELTVVATSHASYSTSSNPFRALIRGWGAPQADANEHVVVVFVPRREQRTGLLHPLIVHELGHAIEQEFALVTDILQVAAQRSRLLKRLTAVVQSYASAKSLSNQEAAGEIGYRLARWIEEALCDALATEFLGPTYLFAFLTEVAAANMDQPGPKHPPPRQRIRLMRSQLERLGWDHVLAQSVAPLDVWVRDAASAAPTYSGVDEFLVWSLDALAPHIQRRAGRHVKAHRFLPEVAALNEVETLLRHHIPPAQTSDGRAVKRQDIIVGSWIYALREAGANIDAATAAPDSATLRTLLPKGLEMSALVEAWKP